MTDSTSFLSFPAPRWNFSW